MITVANRIFVAPEYHDQFEARFRDRARLVDGRPGFIANHVLRPTEDGAPFIVLTFWESREAFEAWTSSDAFRQGHARSGSLPREAFSGPNVLEVHEVVQSSGTPVTPSAPVH